MMRTANTLAQAPTVPLLPDGSLTWEVHDVPSLNAELFLSPSASRKDAELAKVMAVSANGFTNATEIGSGARGSVYRIGNKAVKRLTNPESPQEDDLIMGLSALRANVGLGIGLKQIGEVDMRVAGNKVDKIEFRTPEYFAMILPHGDLGDSIRPVWIMSYEDQKPLPAQLLPYPCGGDRKALYKKAMDSVGINPMDVNYDDGLANLRIRRSVLKRRLIIAKLDVVAKKPLIY